MRRNALHEVKWNSSTAAKGRQRSFESATSRLRHGVDECICILTELAKEDTRTYTNIPSLPGLSSQQGVMAVNTQWWEITMSFYQATSLKCCEWSLHYDRRCRHPAVTGTSWRNDCHTSRANVALLLSAALHMETRFRKVCRFRRIQCIRPFD